MSFVKVEGHEQLVRDMSTGAIINNNIAEKEKYLKKREALRASRNRIDNIENNVDNLNKRIDNIEGKLDTLINLLTKDK